MRRWATLVAGALVVVAVTACEGASDEDTARLGRDLDGGLRNIYLATSEYIRNDGTQAPISEAYVEVCRLCLAVERDIFRGDFPEFENADWSLYSDICDRLNVIMDGRVGDILEYFPELRQDLRVLIPD